MCEMGGLLPDPHVCARYAAWPRRRTGVDANRAVSLEDEIGVLMCTGPARADRPRPECAVFVTADWLRWFLSGEKAGYRAADTLAPTHILGCIPVWPDSFFEWLAAIVDSGITFTWQRHPDGYLVLAQS